MRVQPVAQAVAEKIEPEDGDEDRQPRKNCCPGRDHDEFAGVCQHVSPARERRLDAETEIGKCCFRKDRIAHAERPDHQDRADHVGQDLRDHDADVAVTERLGRLDIALLLQGQRRASRDATGP
ncbi:hypothetical protein D9M69_706380 [compost metagenome]